MIHQLFAIYGPNQVEYPGRFVVRLWTNRQPPLPPIPDLAPHALAESLEDARTAIPAGSFLVPRGDGDNVALIESWILPGT